MAPLKDDGQIAGQQDVWQTIEAVEQEKTMTPAKPRPLTAAEIVARRMKEKTDGD